MFQGWFWGFGAAGRDPSPAQPDHVTGVLPRQTGSVAELLLRTRRQTLASQSDQVLQAVNQPLVTEPHLRALHLVAMAANTGLRQLQLPLNSQTCAGPLR